MTIIGMKALYSKLIVKQREHRAIPASHTRSFLVPTITNIKQQTKILFFIFFFSRRP